MKRVIIHVGPHKTGSTYIQKALFVNRKYLKSKGVSYPKIYMLAVGQHYLVDALRSKQDVKKIRQKIEQKVDSANICILSSENYYQLPPPALQRFKEVFSDTKADLVFFYRTPSIRMKSAWHEEIKHGKYRSYTKFYFQNLKHAYGNITVNPLRYLNALAKIFGRKCIHIVDYQTSTRNQSLIRDFWKASALPVLVNDNPKRENTMLPIEEVELLRQLNIFAQKDNILKGPNIREKYINRRENNISLVEEFKKKISFYKEKENLGNYHIDRMVRNIMQNQWRDCFSNEISKIQPQEGYFINETWQQDNDLIIIAEKVYKKINGKINYR